MEVSYGRRTRGYSPVRYAALFGEASARSRADAGLASPVLVLLRYDYYRARSSGPRALRIVTSHGVWAQASGRARARRAPLL